MDYCSFGDIKVERGNKCREQKLNNEYLFNTSGDRFTLIFRLPEDCQHLCTWMECIPT